MRTGKPILTFGTEIAPVGRVRTRRRALERMGVESYLGVPLRDKDGMVHGIRLEAGAAVLYDEPLNLNALRSDLIARKCSLPKPAAQDVAVVALLPFLPSSFMPDFREGHFVYPNGKHSPHYFQMPLAASNSLLKNQMLQKHMPY